VKKHLISLEGSLAPVTIFGTCGITHNALNTKWLYTAIWRRSPIK